MAEEKAIVKRKKANPGMNQKDRAEISKMLVDAMKAHSENVGLILKGSLEVIEVKLDAIKSDTAKTNGKVAEHEKEIQKLKEINIGHVMNCPNTAKLTKLEQMEISRKAVSSFTWRQIGAIGVIAGLILSLLTFLLK